MSPSFFPSALDSFTNPTTTDTLASVPHHLQHANANDAIRALELKVGIDNSADTSSLDFKVRTVGHTHVWNDIPSGTVNGVNAVFVLTQTPNPAGSLLLFLGGMLQMAGGNDYALAGRTVTFTSPPPAGLVVVAQYVV